MKQIPNVLSLSRIPLSVLLPLALLFTEGPTLFVLLYVICGLTDVLDGFLARRFHWESPFGAKIDGFADIVFMLGILAAIFGVVKPSVGKEVVIGILIIAALKLMNLVFTKLKFKQWSTMHTFANKYTAFPFYLIVPVVVILGEVPNGLAILLLCTVLVAVLEETLILIQLKEYDANMKSIFSAKGKKAS